MTLNQGVATSSTNALAMALRSASVSCLLFSKPEQSINVSLSHRRLELWHTINSFDISVQVRIRKTNLGVSDQTPTIESDVPTAAISTHSVSIRAVGKGSS